MKMIIYAGIGLFCSAAVYGFADFYISNSKGQVDNIYKEDDDEAERMPPSSAILAAGPLQNADKRNNLRIKPEIETLRDMIKPPPPPPNLFEIEADDFSRGRISKRDVVVIVDTLPVPAMDSANVIQTAKTIPVSEEIKRETPVVKEETLIKPATVIREIPEKTEKTVIVKTQVFEEAAVVKEEVKMEAKEEKETPKLDFKKFSRAPLKKVKKTEKVNSN